jgi:hypothetical protein
MKKLSRRSFVEASALGLAASALTVSEANAADRPKVPFVHHVFFWLKNPGNAAEAAQLEKALKALGKIEVIRMAHVGKPVVTAFDKPVTDGSYSFSVMLVFDNAKDEEIYLLHPLHKKFIDDNKHLWNKVVVYDSVMA